jgi:hypothetical protein
MSIADVARRAACMCGEILMEDRHSVSAEEVDEGRFRQRASAVRSRRQIEVGCV